MATGDSIQLVLAVAGLLLGLLGSATFAGLETGVYVLNRVRLELRAAQGSRQAARLAWALGRPQELLTALLAGTNASVYLVTLSTVALFEMAGAGHVDLYATAVATPLVFTLGQMFPKNLFRVAGETLTYRLSAVIPWVMWVTRWLGISPVLMAFSRAILWLSSPGRRRVDQSLVEPRQRVAALLAEGRAHGVLTPFQSHLAHRVVSLRSTRVRDVMVELARVASIPAGTSRERFMQALPALRHPRLPVWKDRPANIVGIVNIYDVLFDENPQAAPADHVVEPIRVLDQLNVSEALVALQRAGQPMGLVVNAMDRLVGIVTIRDLLDEIIGELEEW